ncbi:SseB family protein [Catenulispora pinisilvae]|uniref:SseB family protein n=1 Tax=Catenulispora pinisilvae TaxID=2705253 RepID=UPI0018912013|nr:SseB family protein [Catenulispora pinisilvae]
MAAVTGVLADYARGEASESDVVRALLAHDGWYAPMLWLSEVFPDRKVYDSMIPTPALGQAPAPGRLWVFTDAEQVAAAIEAGSAFAAAGGPVRGVELFGALGNSVSEIQVNPAGLAEHGWSVGIDDAVLDFLARWIGALEVETSLSESAEDLGERLAGFQHYVVPVDDTGRPRVVSLHKPPGNYVMAFTAPDLYAEHQKRDPGVTGAADMPAATLFQLADYDGVDGVVLDMKESDSFILPQDLCSAVLKLIA